MSPCCVCLLLTPGSHPGEKSGQTLEGRVHLEPRASPSSAVQLVSGPLAFSGECVSSVGNDPVTLRGTCLALRNGIVQAPLAGLEDRASTLGPPPWGVLVGEGGHSQHTRNSSFMQVPTLCSSSTFPRWCGNEVWNSSSSSKHYFFTGSPEEDALLPSSLPC